MSQLSACDHGFESCNSQLKAQVPGFCPCDGCLSRFSCRGYGNSTLKSADRQAAGQRFVLRFDVSYATVKNQESHVCTPA